MARQKGNSNFTVEVLLDVQSRRVSDTRFERVTGSEVVNVTDRISRVTWGESVLTGGFSFELVLADMDWDFWKKLIAGQEGSKLQLRLTFTSEGTVERTPWRTCYLDVPKTDIQSKILRMVLEGGDKRFEMMQIGRFLSYNSKRIVDVVQEISSRYNLTADVADMDDTPYDRLQPGISDWDFLKSRILGSCATRNRGDVYLWVDEGILKLKPIDYAQQPLRSYAIGLTDDRVLKAVLSMNNRKADRQGAARTLATGFDFDAKEGRSFEVGREEAGKAPALSAKLPRAQSGGLLNLADTSQSGGSLERRAFRAWGLASTLYAELEITMKPDLTLVAGGMISFTAESTLHQSLFVDGSYPVLSVKHELSRTNARTTVTVARRETQIGVEDAPGTRVGQQPRDGYLSDSGEQGRKVVQVRTV